MRAGGPSQVILITLLSKSGFVVISKVAVAKGNWLQVSKLRAYARLPSRRDVARQAGARPPLLPAAASAGRL